MKAHRHDTLIAVGCLVIAGASWGCGASIQAVYEGDVRFERCMALDVRPEIAVGERRECWTDWVVFYTYGQTRDRLRHAHLRIKQLSAGGAAAPDEGRAAPKDPTSVRLLPPATSAADPDDPSR